MFNICWGLAKYFLVHNILLHGLVSPVFSSYHCPEWFRASTPKRINLINVKESIFFFQTLFFSFFFFSSIRLTLLTLLMAIIPGGYRAGPSDIKSALNHTCTRLKFTLFFQSMTVGFFSKLFSNVVNILYTKLMFGATQREHRASMVFSVDLDALRPSCQYFGPIFSE